jgi:hypothetical protein
MPRELHEHYMLEAGRIDDPPKGGFTTDEGLVELAERLAEHHAAGHLAKLRGGEPGFDLLSTIRATGLTGDQRSRTWYPLAMALMVHRQIPAIPNGGEAVVWDYRTARGELLRRRKAGTHRLSTRVRTIPTPARPPSPHG